MSDKYTSWPLGNLPPKFRRSEPDEIRKHGYKWEDARDIVDIFERKVADFAGSKYAVAVDSCSNGLFLCLKMLIPKEGLEITIPSRTYISVPQMIIHAGGKPISENINFLP